MRWILTLLLGLLSACTTNSEISNTGASQLSFDANTIHNAALVIDAHADIEIPGAYSIYVGADGKSRVAADKLKAGGVDAVVMAVSVALIPRNAEGYADAKLKADSELNAVLNETKAKDDDLVLAISPSKLQDTVVAGQTALILGFQNADIFGEDLGGFDEYYQRGVRVFALTHLGHNNYADSSRPRFIAAQGKHEPVAEHGGLSPLGQQAVTRINRLGAVLDVSQLSKQATQQAVKQSIAPVIASHSNVRALTDVSRSLSDEEIDLIAAKDGVIHVTPFRAYMYDSTDPELDRKIRAARVEAGILESYYYPFELYWEMDDPIAKKKFLTTVSELIGPGSLDLVVDHIDYIVNRVGIDHVGIGSDFNHGGGIEGFQDASGAQNLTQTLLARGYSKTDINKIWGENFMRVWRQAEALKTAQQ